MKSGIFDLAEFALLAFFAAVNGIVLILSNLFSSEAKVLILVATILLLLVLIIQFLRKLSAMHYKAFQ